MKLQKTLMQACPFTGARFFHGENNQFGHTQFNEWLVR